MKIEELSLFGDRVVIEPAEIFTYTKSEWITDDELNVGKGQDDEKVMKEITRDVKSFYQFAKVVSIGDGVNKVKVGDNIIYNIHACAQLELIKGLGVLKQYDIVGIVNN